MSLFLLPRSQPLPYSSFTLVTWNTIGFLLFMLLIPNHVSQP